MRYPNTEHFGSVRDPDGKLYSLHFYGENEGAAVITGPVPGVGGAMHAVPEVHREHADNADEAHAKLAIWCKNQGWRS